MGTAPTLQNLALYAHDHFAEESSALDDSISSSLDVVMETYATEPDHVCQQAGSLLRERLERQGHDVDRGEVEGFVQVAVTYLEAVYPDGEAVREEEEQRLLSQLFSAHLAEAHISAQDARRRAP